MATYTVSKGFKTKPNLEAQIMSKQVPMANSFKTTPTEIQATIRGIQAIDTNEAVHDWYHHVHPPPLPQFESG